MKNENIFLQRISERQSQRIQEEISKFLLEDFISIHSLPIASIARTVQDKITELLKLYAKTWRVDLEKEEEEYNCACDWFENVITKKLYNRIFSVTKEDKENDYLFELQTQTFSFITPQHLEIDSSIINEIYISAAINKLAMINQYKSPKDKISTIINFCNILSAMIVNATKEKSQSINNNKPSSAGADEVLPVVVYALLRGNIKKLKSNISYIRLFRHHSMFDSNKEEYFTTVLESGVEFIAKLSPDSDLKIDKGEFKRLIEISKRKIKEERSKVVLPVNKKNADESFLVYYLSEGDSEVKKEKGKSPIELDVVKGNACKINASSVIDKEVLNEEEGLTKIDIDKLYKEYFDKDLKEMSLFQIEKMINDFKITVMLIDSYVNKGKLTQTKKENN